MPDTKDTKEGHENVVSLTTPEFMFLLQRIDRVEEKLSTRINQVEEKLSTRINQVEEKLSARINQVEEKLSARINQVEENLKQDNRALRGLIWTTLGLMTATIGIAVTIAISVLA